MILWFKCLLVFILLCFFQEKSAFCQKNDQVIEDYFSLTESGQKQASGIDSLGVSEKSQGFITSGILNDSVSWREVAGAEDYTEKSEKKKKQRITNSQVTLPSAGSGLIKFIQVAGLVILFVLIIFIVYRIIKLSTTRNKNFDEDSEFWQIDLNKSDVAESEINDKLRNAITEGNYVFAIRLYYLKCLNELNRNHLIEWKKDKTNAVYIRELRDKELKKSFRLLTRIFELYWFGERVANEHTFVKIEKEYLSFLKVLSA